MNITIAQFKGGMGKSMIAHQLITGFGYKGVEIDPYGSLADRLPDTVMGVSISEKQLTKPSENTIFDFGGFDDIKIDQAISYSDLVIVPYVPTVESVQSTIDTLQRISKCNKPILLIANMALKKEDIADASAVFFEVLGYEVETFFIPMSPTLQTAINENKSVISLAQQPGIKAYAYKKMAAIIQELHHIIISYENK